VPALAVEVQQCPLRFGARSPGPAVPTEIRNLAVEVRSGSAQWHLELAAEEQEKKKEEGGGEGESNSDKI